MTRKWGCQEKESEEAIRHFVEAYDRPKYQGLTKQTIVESLVLAQEFKHDVFGCVYLSFALQERARSIITTDTDFERLCKKAGLEYANPVPLEVLRRFKE